MISRILWPLIAALVFLLSAPALASDLYWVGGSASWDATAGTKWASSSGGAGGQPIPTATDNCFIDSGSGSVTVTVAAAATCHDLKFVSGAGAFAGTFAGSSTLAISGDLVLSASMTRTYTGAITFNSTAAQTITPNGKALASNLTLDGVGGSWQLQGDLVAGAVNTITPGIVTLTNGTLDLNNHNLTAVIFSSSNSNARTITSGTGQFFINGGRNSGATTVWDTNTRTNLTITNRFTINATATVAAPAILRTFNLGISSESIAPSIVATGGGDRLTFNGSMFNIDISGLTAGSYVPNTQTIYGDANFAASAALEAIANAATFGSTNATPRTITTGGVTLDFPLTFNGAGGTWKPGDTLTQGATRAFTLTNGTFDGNGQNLSIGTFALGAGTKTLSLGSGAWTVNGSGASAWNANTNVSGLTVSASSGKISMISASAKTFAGGGKSWPILEQAGAGALSVTQANAFADIQATAAGIDSTVTLPASTTTTVSAFSLGGTVGHPVTLNSSVAGTAALLSKTSGTVSASNLSIKDSHAIGGAIWNAFTANGNADVSGNSGWHFAPFNGGGNFFMFFGDLSPRLRALIDSVANDDMPLRAAA